MIHEIFYLNEDGIVPSKYEADASGDNVWCLDNGASNHMTGDERYFRILDDTITGKVKFGDDSRIDIKGKGSIEFIDRNGETRMMEEVYYIPDLKSNIISLGQATESGCGKRLRGEYLTMHDREGKLLVKALRARNRLYKVRMGLKEELCLHSTMLGDSNIWHSRLGHVNQETIRYMMQRDLVTGMPQQKIEKEVCGSCMLGKQARQPFPKSTSYRATKIRRFVWPHYSQNNCRKQVYLCSRGRSFKVHVVNITQGEE